MKCRTHRPRSMFPIVDGRRRRYCASCQSRTEPKEKVGALRLAPSERARILALRTRVVRGNAMDSAGLIHLLGPVFPLERVS
jgi:hypothetical protein